MANPYAVYSKRAATIARHHPAPLIGVTKTRREAMIVYQEIVTELQACDDRDTLECYLVGIPHHLAQFKAELPLLWAGDGEEFPGLKGEIEAAFSRVSGLPESGADRSFGYFEEGMQEDECSN